MKRFCYLLFLFVLISSGQKAIASTKKEQVKSDTTSTNILWRESRYDKQLKDTVNTIVLNEEYCQTLSEPERAALGYIGSFIGSDNEWDGEPKEDMSNLKSKILTILNLGYQRSEKHLSFLRKWFKNDPKALSKLENCPLIPSGATVQNTFDKIDLTVKGDTISVDFKASGINLKEGKSWEWTETDLFKFSADDIKLIKQEKSNEKTTHFEN